MLYVNPLEGRVDALQMTPSSDARRDATLEEYEKLFVHQLVKAMRETVPEDPLFGKSSQRDVFYDMLDDQVAEVMAKSGQLGIADHIRSQIALLESPRPEPPAEASGIALRAAANAGIAVAKVAGIALTRAGVGDAEG